MPIFLPVILSIRLTSRGPAFFRQARIGRHRKPFQLIKFRSMEVDAERRGPQATAKKDPRITPIGHLLRATKLDELPELWNVMRGDLSLVGPRPEVPRFVEHYRPEWEAVFSVRPGITDLATLQFRDEEPILEEAVDKEKAYLEVILPLKIELALEYIARQSFWLDIKILFLTVWGITLGRFFAPPGKELADRAKRQVLRLNENNSLLSR